MFFYHKLIVNMTIKLFFLLSSINYFNIVGLVWRGFLYAHIKCFILRGRPSTKKLQLWEECSSKHRIVILWVLIYLFVCLMVFNATVNNSSAVSWRSVLLVEETRLPVEKTADLSQVIDKLYHIMLYTSLWSRFGITFHTIQHRQEFTRVHM